MGSRFIVTQEAPVPLHVKQYLVDKTETDTVVTDNFTGVRCRVIQNRFAENLVEMAKNHADPWKIMKVGVEKIRKAYVEGDLVGGSLAFGQVCGLIQGIPSCQELIDGIIKEAEEILQSFETFVQPQSRTHILPPYPTTKASCSCQVLPRRA